MDVLIFADLRLGSSADMVIVEEGFIGAVAAAAWRCTSFLGCGM